RLPRGGRRGLGRAGQPGRPVAPAGQAQPAARLTPATALAPLTRRDRCPYRRFTPMTTEAAQPQVSTSSEGHGLNERALHALPLRVVKRYLDAQGLNSATLIAWNALFAAFPIVLITF